MTEALIIHYKKHEPKPDRPISEKAVRQAIKEVSRFYPTKNDTIIFSKIYKKLDKIPTFEVEYEQMSLFDYMGVKE